MGYIQDLRRKIGHDPVILVGAVAVIRDTRGAVLLQKRTFPKGSWGVPGGLMEPGESAEETAIREIREETGLTVGRLTLLQVYSGVRVPVVAENGDQYYPVTIAFEAQAVSGEWRIDPAESEGFAFFTSDQIPDSLLKNQQKILHDYFRKFQYAPKKP